LGISTIGSKNDSSSHGLSGRQELVRIEKLTAALKTLSKVDNLLETFVTCIDEMKRIMGRELHV